MIEIKRNKPKPAQMPVKRTQMPADGLETPANKEQATPAETPLQAEIMAFTGIGNGQDYRAMYRAVFDFHEQHNPPRVDTVYWQTHTPCIDDTPQSEVDFWAQAWQDLRKVCEAFNNDQFIIAMMGAVMNEINREYEADRRAASYNGARA